MIQWELSAQSVYIDTGGRFSVNVDPSAVWTVKGKNGKTSWDNLTAMADEGWELVSVTPISTSYTPSNDQNHSTDLGTRRE